MNTLSSIIGVLCVWTLVCAIAFLLPGVKYREYQRGFTAGLAAQSPDGERHWYQGYVDGMEACKSLPKTLP